MKHKSELSAYLGLVQSLEWRQVESVLESRHSPEFRGTDYFPRVT